MNGTRVLVGALDSREGRTAIEAAAAEARLRRGAVLLVVHLDLAVGTTALDDYDKLRDEAVARAEEVAQPLRETGLEVEVHVAEGQGGAPAEALLMVAREQDAGLIVIGIRRRSRVGKVILGSNAQDVLLGADVPVLAVKPHQG